MNRKQTDVLAGILVVGIVLAGVLTAVLLLVDGGPSMGDGGSAPAVMRSFGPVLMSIVVASVVGGVYLYARKQLFTTDADTAGDQSGGGAPAGTEDTPDDAGADHPGSAPGDPSTERQILDVLPEDEHRVLEPVLESPGLTQIEVRDRSGYSKSKVSQTISDLEQRGLLYRETQGRTYRVYPAEDLDERV